MVESVFGLIWPKDSSQNSSSKKRPLDDCYSEEYNESTYKRRRLPEEEIEIFETDFSPEIPASLKIIDRIKSAFSKIMDFTQPDKPSNKKHIDAKLNTSLSQSYAEKENAIGSNSIYESIRQQRLSSSSAMADVDSSEVLPKSYSSAIKIDKRNKSDILQSSFKFEPSTTTNEFKPHHKRRSKGSQQNNTSSNKNYLSGLSKHSLKIFRPTFSDRLSQYRKNLSSRMITPRESFCMEDKMLYKNLLQQHTSSFVSGFKSFKDCIKPRRTVNSDADAERSIACIQQHLEDSWASSKALEIQEKQKQKSLMEDHPSQQIPKMLPDIEVVTLESDEEEDDDIVITKSILKSPRHRNNTLEDKLLTSPLYTGDHLVERKNVYDMKKQQNKQEAEAIEERVKQFREKSKRHEENIRKLDESIGRRLATLDLTYTAPIKIISEEPEFPQITDKMRIKVKIAIQGGPLHEVLADKFNIQITRKDIHTLTGLNWLNDEIINFYMNLIMERNKEKNLLNVYAFNTFLYQKLENYKRNNKKYDRPISKWTKKVDIFSYDVLFAPIHCGVHWCMSSIDFRSKVIRYYDSMHGNNDNCLQILRQYLNDEHMDKKKSPFDTSDWILENIKDIPQQMNGSDCGMFACKFAEYLSRDVDITFTQKHMPYFRERMIYEIVTKNLM